jgi:hypothetical protein
LLNNDLFKKTYSTSGNSGSDFQIELWTTPDLSGSNPYRFIYNSNNQGITQNIASGTYYFRIGISGNASDDKIFIKHPYYLSGTYTLTFNLATKDANQAVVNYIMLNEGNHAYPYQKYKGEIVREKDIEPVLLWENGSPNSAFASQTLTLPNFSQFKYIVVESYGGVITKVKNRVTEYDINIETKPLLYYMNTATGNYYGREFKINSFTEILFGNTTEALAYDSSVKNDELIPLRIYGTNVL